MVVNERIEIKIDTFIIAAILVCLVFNLCAGLFDSQRTSSIISVSYLIALFCIRTTFFRVKKVCGYKSLIFCLFAILYLLLSRMIPILILISWVISSSCYYIFASG